MKHVLVTGYSGKIAPAIVSRLENEFQVTLFSRKPLDTGYPVVVGDLTSFEDCQSAMVGVDMVVHLAACSEPDPNAFPVNVYGTYNLLEAARIEGVQRFISASTNCVYGHCFPLSDRCFPLAYLPIDEDHPLVPEDNYGITKVLAEKLLETYTDTWGITTAALRLTWVWGEKETRDRIDMQEFKEDVFAPYFWSYVDELDVAEAVYLTLTTPELPKYGVYNIMAADTMSELDTSELVRRFYPDVELKRAFTGRESLFDCNRAKEAFNYNPQYSWRRKK
jgi:nucleoside-diphosphate-sugar epimerase